MTDMKDALYSVCSGGSKTILILILMFSLLPCFSAPGSETSLGGYLKFFAHPNTNYPHPWDRLGSRLQFNVHSQVSNRAAVFSSLDFNYEETTATGLAGESRSAGMTIYPVETYIDFYFSRLDLRIGKQFIFWGTADWVNPTDNINPWDYVNIAAEVEDYRIPVTAVKSNLYMGDWTITGIWILKFLPHKIPIRLPEQMGSLPVETTEPQLPAHRLKDGEFAVKIASTLMNVNFSFSYYYGFDKNPSFIYHFIPFPEPFIQVQTRYYRQSIWGVDFVTTMGKWGFKGEGAFFETRDKSGTNVFIQNPHLKYVLGVDYYPTDKLTLTGQFSQTVLFKYNPEDEQARYARLGMQGMAVPERFTQSLSGRANYQLSDYSSLQLIGVLNLKDRDFFLLPIFSYQFADALNLYAGATLFEGPSDSPFGRNKPYSRLFFEIKYSFSIQ